jgi:hypothetical protein
MRELIAIPIDETVASRGAVLGAMGVPAEREPSQRTVRLADASVSMYRRLAEPNGAVSDISIADFERVYYGEGNNVSETPLGDIFMSSDHLSLYAVTIGRAICEEITRLFDVGDFALASALDAAASEGTETAAQALESVHRDYLKRKDLFGPSMATLRFSPGYCGWHISAQKKLFEYLNPGDIGISLRESFLMEPLKSISGVVVCGREDIFDFDDSFPFCSECETRSCRERLGQVKQQ